MQLFCYWSIFVPIKVNPLSLWYYRWRSAKSTGTQWGYLTQRAKLLPRNLQLAWLVNPPPIPSPHWEKPSTSKRLGITLQRMHPHPFPHMYFHRPFTSNILTMSCVPGKTSASAWIRIPWHGPIPITAVIPTFSFGATDLHGIVTEGEVRVRVWFWRTTV